ncbi:MAG: hypothetical protein N2Z74_06840, partial [Syntrophales bacterium]|nr:hypothetical protein [Syntrophales bacterium]
MKNEKNNTRHRWKFFRAGGFDQVRIETGADLANLPLLDQKLWMVLSCPVGGIEFDEQTASLIDTDGDGRIRVPEILEAVRWSCELLKDPDVLTKRNEELPLSAINDDLPEGRLILHTARRILANQGKEGKETIGVSDTADAALVLSQQPFNGDGIITEDGCEDPEIKGIITDIIATMGGETDRSGKPGISSETLERFFSAASAYLAWWQEGEERASELYVLGENTPTAASAFLAVADKIEDFFARCRLAAYDERALGILQGREEGYLAMADKNLASALDEAATLPLAAVNTAGRLPLTTGLNPAWQEAVAKFREAVIKPLLGDVSALGEEEWRRIKGMFAPYFDWQSRAAAHAVAPLGMERIRAIATDENRRYLESLIEKDRQRAEEFAALVMVDRLVRYHRDLFTLLNNFVSFSDFYTRKHKAVFQAGTLYLDGRSCELCVKVNDMAAHGTLAALSRIYLAYCD